MTTNELLDLFAVSDNLIPRVYLLGCHAGRVTMYSQQIRALNLIYALVDTGALRKGSAIAVIGAGAAGLMAAAAAAHFGAKVTVIERLQEPLALQRNNRQRWIHPFIYDWPDLESPSDHADLPFFDWKAGYAEKVAQQIDERWTSILSSPGYQIECLFNVDSDKLQITEYLGQAYINCRGMNKGEVHHFGHRFDLVILAVGFGVEPETGAKFSYWAEDNIDTSGVHADLTEKSWLISGCGDGGLTDVMRLCIRNFRHERVTTMFAQTSDILEVQSRLGPSLQAALLTLKNDQERELYLSAELENIANRFDLLPDYQLNLRNHQAPKVFLTGVGPTPYTSRSSILNKLIICQLARHGAFTYFQGPAQIMGKKGQKQMVRFGHPRGYHTRTFDRVIERHGPKASINDRCFAIFKRSFAQLRGKWDQFRLADDPTRRRCWPSGFFGENREPLPLFKRDLEFDGAVKRLGIRLGSLTVIKELRSDGGSTLNYQFEQLSVLDGGLAALRFSFSSSLGSVGALKFDGKGQSLGLEWQPDSKVSPTRGLRSVDQFRRLSGLIAFPNQLTPTTPPVSFGVSFRVHNGDALSTWEFEQMYAPEERIHINREPLGDAIEYLARIVWLPIETLRMRVTLPPRVPSPPYLSEFACEGGEQIGKEDVWENAESVLTFPRKDSRWHPNKRTWHRIEDPHFSDGPTTRLLNTSPRTWELTVAKPSVGSCYSLDWRLRPPLPALDGLAQEAVSFREHLMAHRAERINGAVGNAAIIESLGELIRSATKIFVPAQEDGFEVSVMTYDHDSRSLVFVDGLVDGSPLPSAMWKSRLPFGVGIAGACFKETAILQYRSELVREEEPRFYLPFSTSKPHRVLVCLPLDHPRFTRSVDLTDGFDRSRQCVGVVNVGSIVSNPRLVSLPEDTDNCERLSEICQKFCLTVYTKLFKAKRTRA